MTPYEISSYIIQILAIAGGAGFAGIQIGMWIEKKK